MIYSNTDLSALDALERARTGVPDYEADASNPLKCGAFQKGEDGYGELRSRFIGFCECRGCFTEIYSDDEYYEVESCGSRKGDVKLVCESCMNVLDVF